MSNLIEIAPKFNLTGPIDFTFDESVMEYRKVEDAWPDFAELRQFFGDSVKNMPIYRDDRDVKPLQAADMLAGRMLDSLRENFAIAEPCADPDAHWSENCYTICQNNR